VTSSHSTTQNDVLKISDVTPISASLRSKLLSFDTAELTPISDRDPAFWLSNIKAEENFGTPPPNTEPVIIDFIQPNLIRRSVYQSCDKMAYYVLDRGGVVDQLRWFGPLESINFR
jgi:hypothetical protein